MSTPTCVVTGATRGIGAAIAAALGERGAGLVLTGRSGETIDEARSRATADVVRDALWLPLDVRDTGSVDAFVKAAAAEAGPAAVLVNNAGVGGGGPTVDTPDEAWLELIDTNLNGTWRVTQRFLALDGALARPGGRIVNVASTGGKQGVVLAPAYTASKHGVVGLTKALALELAPTGIRVNAVCPGFVETELSVGARERYAAAWGTDVATVVQRQLSRVPIGRYIDPAEVASLVAYLAFDAPDSVTAQAYNVCGGLGTH